MKKERKLMVVKSRLWPVRPIVFKVIGWPLIIFPLVNVVFAVINRPSLSWIDLLIIILLVTGLCYVFWGAKSKNKLVHLSIYGVIIAAIVLIIFAISIIKSLLFCNGESWCSFFSFVKYIYFFLFTVAIYLLSFITLIVGIISERTSTRFQFKEKNISRQRKKGTP